MFDTISVKEAAARWDLAVRTVTGLCQDGRYDIQLAPKTDNLPCIIIELKTEKNCTEKELKALATTALKQINDKKYDTDMKTKGVKSVYKFGVAFSGKKVEVEAE